VGGYGSDQAMLKYEIQPDIRPKIVMLCIFPENINRIVNIYRPFYTYDDPLSLTKPMYVRKGNRFKLIANPVTCSEDLSKLEDPTFLSDLAMLDYWYQFDSKLPRLSFPWTLSLFYWWKPIRNQLSVSLPYADHFFRERSYPGNLFDESYPFDVMCHVVDRFVALARARGSIPIIVVMPHKDYVQELIDNRLSRVAKFTDFLSNRKYHFVDAIGAVADMKPSKLQLDSWYHGHATRKGNLVLAEILHRYVEANFGALLTWQARSR
jgi:hypothetical protein